MAFGDPYLSTQWHQQYAPYAWSVDSEGTQVAQLAANYAVQKLCPAGSPAVYAGGALKNKPRKFALLAPENSWYQVSVQVAQQYMAAHGCPASIYTYTLDLGTESQQAANLVAKMKSDGITTMLCGCDPIWPVYFGGQAFQNNYLPEFIDVGTASPTSTTTVSCGTSSSPPTRWASAPTPRPSPTPRRSATPPTRPSAPTSRPSSSTRSTSRWTRWPSASRWPART